MSKIILILNSHSLDNFQRCERRYLHAEIEHLREKEDKYAIAKGTIVHSMLRYFYLGLMKKRSRKELVNFTHRWLKHFAINNPKTLTSIEVIELYTRFIEYVQEYNQSSWKIKGVEVGFSRKLYESSNVIFIYEGTMDVIVELQGKLRAWIDHKSQSRKYNYFKSENQFTGYTWALNARHGILNYFGLQKVKSDNTFRQDLWSYSKDELEEWRENTIGWYDKIVEVKIKDKYLKKRQGCRNVFGICEFEQLCAVNNSYLLERKRKQNYIIREHKSW